MRTGNCSDLTCSALMSAVGKVSSLKASAFPRWTRFWRRFPPASAPCSKSNADRKLFRSDLQRFDVGGWKGEQFKGERIPTLDSILATIPSGKRAVLEIKCGPEIVPI